MVGKEGTAGWLAKRVHQVGWQRGYSRLVGKEGTAGWLAKRVQQVGWQRGYSRLVGKEGTAGWLAKRVQQVGWQRGYSRLVGTNLHEKNPIQFWWDWKIAQALYCANQPDPSLSYVICSYEGLCHSAAACHFIGSAVTLLLATKFIYILAFHAL